MIQDVELQVPADKAYDTNFQHALLKRKLKLDANTSYQFKLVRRSLDARKKRIHYLLKYRVYLNESAADDAIKPTTAKLDPSKQVIIIGSGPAGLFSALKLLEAGIKPIILERGKDVRSRRKDLVKITRFHTVDPDSNYCFGEGGAGTYSDGKLYTRSKKRGNIERILQLLVHFGASDSILIDAHPHIGTNKLPGIIEAIRAYIINAGGEIHFNTRASDFDIKNDQIIGVFDQHKTLFKASAVVLATGHSANDIYELLYDKKIKIEAKPFALGVRVEHPQHLIDQIQYSCDVRESYLPPASYSLVNKRDDRGAYSFCMCPGGIIAPCATNNNEVVTNGWSPSKRNNEFANAGIVVPVYPDDAIDFKDYGPLSGLKFRTSIEHKAWQLGGENQSAPAQRLVDFIKNKKSIDLPACSYAPGIVSVNLVDVLPSFVITSLKRSFKLWAKRMPQFLHKDAVLVGVETRTSSPVRIPRDKVSLEHTDLKGFYPCGEGAGYAGGIISAAIDGERCAEAIAMKLKEA